MQRSMGGFLKKSIGDDYRTFGFVGYEGSYTAWKNGLQSFELPKAHPGTLEYVLGQLDEPLFILDLKKCAKRTPPACNGSAIWNSEKSEQLLRYSIIRRFPTCSII